MASQGALLLGTSRPGLQSNSQNRSPLAAFGLKRFTRASGLPRRTSIRVQAIAAPEKPTSEPFTAWATAIERIPKRTDLKTIMILGAGPIVIGQVRMPRSEHAMLRSVCNSALVETLLGYPASLG
jgi:hypothetical protein